ncbi:MAG TPA: DMT family transporter [Sphingomicrobium sp.]|nr:DMT family transporter [Sphingomicrobium sp.]
MNRVAQHPIQAFAVALAAVAVLSIMDAVMKHLVLAIGIIAVSVWRATSNMAIAAALYLPSRSRWPNRSRMRIHVGRSLIITVMAFLFFWGIGRVPLAQAIALTFIAPLIALLLAGVFLREKIGARSVGGSAVAFAGVLVIVFGQARADVGSDVLLGLAAIIGSALCYAVNIILMRHQALAAKPLEINFFQCLTILVIWIVALPLVGIPDWPGGQWLWIAIASLLSTSGTLLFAWAYARGEASYLAATEYSGFLWAALCGWLVFRESVSLYTLAGATLIVGGCVIAARARIDAPGEMEVAT